MVKNAWFLWDTPHPASWWGPCPAVGVLRLTPASSLSPGSWGCEDEDGAWRMGSGRGGTQVLYCTAQHCSLLWGRQRRRAAGGTCRCLLGWRFAITYREWKETDTGHGWEWRLSGALPWDSITSSASWWRSKAQGPALCCSGGNGMGWAWGWTCPAKPHHGHSLVPSRWRWSRDTPAHRVEGHPAWMNWDVCRVILQQSCLSTVISLLPQVDPAGSLYLSFPCSKMGVIAVNYLPHRELINVCAPL